MMLDELLHRADREQFTISFASLAEGSWPDAVRAEGIPVHVVPQTRWRDIRNVAHVSSELKDIICREGIDLVHASGSSALLGASLGARRSRVPLVWVIFDPLRGSSPKRLLSARRKVSARLLELLHPDWVIFGTARAAESGPPSRATPTSTILPGISFDRFQQGDGPRARRALGIGQATPVVVTLGRLTYLKSQLEFVRVMQRVAESYPDVRGIICGGEGDVAYARRVRELRAELGLDQTITMTGFVSDQLKDDIVDAADVVLHLAKRESFGLAVVEAGAAGKAVIAADASGPRSLIDSGVTGILVPVDDVAATAAAVEGLLADPEQRTALGVAAAQAARRHPVEGMVQEIEQVWKAVLADDGPNRA